MVRSMRSASLRIQQKASMALIRRKRVPALSGNMTRTKGSSWAVRIAYRVECTSCEAVLAAASSGVDASWIHTESRLD